MELRQLRYFIAVARCLNFSRAAQELCITQSTLSQQILQLENELGAPLLVRNSRSVALTDEGASFLEAARQTLLASESCYQHIRDIRELRSGTLNIGCTTTFSLLLNETLRQFVSLHPAIHINIVCHPVQQLMTLLQQGDIDLAISFRPNKPLPNIVSTTLFDTHLCAVLSATHPLSHASSLKLADLQHWPLALPVIGTQARSVFDAIAQRQNLPLDIRLQLNGINMLLSVVASSKHVTMLSHATVAHHSSIVALPLDEQGTLMQGCYHTLAGATTKHAATEFIKILSSYKPLAKASLGTNK